MKYFFFLTILILTLTYSNIFGQREYLVQLNPSNCSFNIIDSIPYVKWIAVGLSTFDKKNNRYVFRGQDTTSNWYLYSINATNGSIISNPKLTSNFGSIKFDDSTGIMYGVHWTTSLSNAEFVSINPLNLNYTVIKAINLTSISSSQPVFDNINHRFMFIAGDSSGVNCLFTLDVITGNIISKPPVGNVFGLQYDNSTGILYGLQWNNSLQTEYFASVNITTGSITTINSIPLVTSVAMGYPTFDEINKRYTFLGMDNSNTKYLFTVDATNGQVVSNPIYPILASPYNIIETRYNNTNGNLYALHWGPIIKPSGLEIYNGVNINIYPNPFSVQTTFQTDRVFNDGILYVENYLGQTVKQIINISGQTFTLHRDNLPSGLYFVRLTQDNKIIATEKVFITD